MKLARILTLTLLGFAVAQTAAAQAPPLPDVDGFGPQVGETVPPFSLVDQHGAGARPRIADGPERTDARLQPFGGLVTALQDAARGAAEPV